MCNANSWIPAFAGMTQPVVCGTQRINSSRRLGSLTLLLTAVAATTILTMGAGCARPRGPLFDRAQHELVWPTAPATPRVRYVGALRNAADLHAGRTMMQGLNDALFGPEAPAPLYGPRAVVCTLDGQRLWVADPGGRCVHLFDLDQRTYRTVRRAGDDPLRAPVGISLGPEGSFYVCDAEAVAIYRFDDRSGAFLESVRLSADVRRPVDAWFDRTTDELYVVDTVAHDVKVLGRDGTMLRVIGSRGNAPGQFNYPTAIDADSERLWIADSGNHRVQALTPQGEAILSIGQAGDAPGDLALPKGIAVDPAGNVHVVDARFENIQVFDRQGQLLLYFGEEGSGYGDFWLPSDLYIEPDGRMWVCDTYNRRIQVFELLNPSQP